MEPIKTLDQWSQQYCQREDMKNELKMIKTIIKNMDDYLESILIPFSQNIHKQNLEDFNKKYQEMLETFGPHMTEEEEDQYSRDESIKMNKEASEKFRKMLPEVNTNYQNILLDKFNNKKITLYELNLSMDILKKRIQSFNSLDSVMADMWGIT